MDPDTELLILQNSGFQCYDLYADEKLGIAFRTLIGYEPQIESIKECHKHFYTETACPGTNSLSLAAARCPTDRSGEALIDLNFALGKTMRGFDHHKKYTQALIGMLAMENSEITTLLNSNTFDHPGLDISTPAQRALRCNRLANFLKLFTYSIFFDKDFPLSKLEGVGQKKMDDFKKCCIMLNLHLPFCEISRELAPLLSPLPADEVATYYLERSSSSSGLLQSLIKPCKETEEPYIEPIIENDLFPALHTTEQSIMRRESESISSSQSNDAGERLDLGGIHGILSANRLAGLMED
jgi:hypothetical protein